jgi:hypothetical protein
MYLVAFKKKIELWGLFSYIYPLFVFFGKYGVLRLIRLQKKWLRLLFWHLTPRPNNAQLTNAELCLLYLL